MADINYEELEDLTLTMEDEDGTTTLCLTQRNVWIVWKMRLHYQKQNTPLTNLISVRY